MFKLSPSFNQLIEKINLNKNVEKIHNISISSPFFFINLDFCCCIVFFNIHSIWPVLKQCMHTISTLLHSPCALSISINVAMFMWMGTPCRQCTWSFKFITYGQLIKISLTFVPHTHAFIHSITHSLALWCMRRLMWDVCNMEYGIWFVDGHHS